MSVCDVFQGAGNALLTQLLNSTARGGFDE